jgi:hypothetical protein
MSTQCHRIHMQFQNLGKREVIAQFDGGKISSDGGGILLREVEKRTGIIKGFSECFTDYRASERVEHTLDELVSQRVYGIALGYEDINDHESLRSDPLLASLVGKEDLMGSERKRERDRGKPLAGKSTLNRLELGTSEGSAQDRYKKIVIAPDKVDTWLVEVFTQAHESPPKRIVLDLDATDDPVHGNQEGRFFHGYYGCYCYLPLYIFCDEHLLCARLRPSNIDACAGTVEELQRIIPQIRCAWPDVEIVIRGDSGFCRDEIMAWCEANEVEYYLGMAKNPRVLEALKPSLREAELIYEETGEYGRAYGDFRYQTLDSWTRARRVVGKAEYTHGKENPRFVVTSVPADTMAARTVYEQEYCARGEMENRLKEQQLDLFADRTSTSALKANQLRLYFSSIAYLLLQGLRRLGLAGTEMAKAQCGTIRVKLLKIGTYLKVTVRRVWLSLSESYPYQELFYPIYQQLMRIPQLE